MTAGTRLGPYEILAPLGAGGMGEVYRARDSRLSRDVAIKVLPAQVASDPELRRRLDREAQAVSSLSHPNICALFDVGHVDGVDFLVMELLDGETLATRLARGALPIDQVLRYGIEIADALATAHRAGIVHRDLKPGNVMLTRTGARLLDFGLAKSAEVLPALDATVSGPITARGTVVGTFQYMSPEQLEGKEVDARSDIFALGALIHEMATGQRAFDGATTASTIAAILERDPPSVSSVQPIAPAALDDIVRGCLAKDKNDRWQTAHDVKLQLEAVRRRLSSGSSVTAFAPVTSARGVWPYIPWAIALVALLAAGGLLARNWNTAPSPASPAVRASLLPPPGHSFTPNDFAVSPDAKRVAFVAAGADGVATLWVSSLQTGQADEIAGSEGAISPFWSADSRWIAFFVPGKLVKVEPGGAGVQPICEVRLNGRGGAWNANDVILFSQVVLGPVMKVSASGGTPVPVTPMPPEMQGEAHRFPQFLPDGERFVYVVSWTNQQRGGLYLGALDGRAPELLSSDIHGRVVVAGTDILYVRDGILHTQELDTATGKLTGSPRAVLRNEVIVDWRFGEVPVRAASGLLLFQSRLNYNTQLVWYDRTGHELGPVGNPGFIAPELSKDDRRALVQYDPTGTGQHGLWSLDLTRRLSSPLDSPGNHTAHNLFPDGSIVYSVQREQNGVFRRPGDGSGVEEKLYESPAHVLVNGVSPDGERVLIMDFARGMPDVRELDVRTKKSSSIGQGAEATYSPDGEWIAYVAAIGGEATILRRSTGSRIQLSQGGGWQIRWRQDMSEIFYIARDKKLMTVALTRRGDDLDPAAPVPLFQTRIIAPTMVLFQYDVTRDGQKFLIDSLPREDAAAPLTILTNWK